MWVQKPPMAERYQEGFNNNLAVHMQLQMDPATYQVCPSRPFEFHRPFFFILYNSRVTEGNSGYNYARHNKLSFMDEKAPYSTRKIHARYN
mgnify:CR=1 FL=1